MEERDLYNSIAPLMYVTNMLSLSNVKMNKHRNRLVISYSNLIFNVIIAAVFFGCSIYATQNSMRDLDESMNSISEATDTFELYSAMITQTIAMLAMCVNSKRFISFFRRLNQVDRKMSVLGEQVSSETNKKFVVTGMSLVTIEFLITFLPDYFLFVDNETTVYLATSYYPIISTGLFKVQLTTLIYFLWQRFFAINRMLRKLKQWIEREKGNKKNTVRLLKSGNSYAEIVATIHNIFNELCALVHSINYLYGLQLLLAMCSAFALCARQIHGSYITLKDLTVRYPLTDVYFSCQWAFVQVMEIFIIIIFAEKTENEINKTVFNLHALYHCNTEEKYLQIEIREFALHMSHKHVRFHVCGFFNVDYSLITTIPARSRKF
ncbi:invertebrate gustatory receptor [Holotrichia oblita]|uniref:Invertebrate gustatory receptor n=1 Tax=Holotrichia oblita TaxID=644536 RepID=A0ACB9TIX9_HOLOL|nr:invertebrate gustatory receptor [Holotrichia oblita]